MSTVLARTLLAGALTTVLAASAPAARADSACTRTLPTGSSSIVVPSGGVDRTAVVHVPASLPPAPVPLVLVLHGAGQQGAYFEGDTGFSTIADAERFVAVYPDALPDAASGGRPFWNMNDASAGRPDDVEFARQLIARVQGDACTDPARVFATGMSNGASMTSRLGCELSDRIAAIAPISGGYGSQPPCTPVHPVSVLEVHGTIDTTVPYAGKAGGFGAVLPYLGRWASWDGCSGRPTHRLLAPRTTQILWHGCAAGTAVGHLRLTGGGHQVPGGAPPEGGQAAPLSAPLMIWRFFAAHPRVASR